MSDWAFTVAGAVTGLIVGITGVGGGALMTPILLLMFGVSPTTAIATDLWFATVTKLVGARMHQKAGHVDWQVVRRLWLGSLPTALIVVIWVAWVEPINKLTWMNSAIGGVILVTALGLLFSGRLQALARSRRIENPRDFKLLQPALTVVCGGLLGLLVALTSVGAGALGTVMLLYLYPLRMTPHKLISSDLVHAIPLATIAGLGYLYAGLVDFHMLTYLLAGSLPTVVAGSWVAQRINPAQLKFILALVLLGIGAKLIW